MTRFLLSMLVFGFVSCGDLGKESKQKEDKHGHPLFLADFVKEYDRTQLVQWVEGPKVGTKATNRIRFLFVKKDGSVPDSVNGFKFWPFMKVHGHGAKYGEDGLQVEEIEPHIYEASSFFFTMGGKWELEVRVTLEGKYYELSIDLEDREFQK